MAFGDRLGIAGIILGALGVGCAMLWQTQRWIGWIFMVIGIGCGLGWGVLEYRERGNTETTHTSDVAKTTDGEKSTTTKLTKQAQPPPRPDLRIAIDHFIDDGGSIKSSCLTGDFGDADNKAKDWDGMVQSWLRINLGVPEQTLFNNPTDVTIPTDRNWNTAQQDCWKFVNQRLLVLMDISKSLRRSSR
jgi:hypothetical protein